MRMRFAMLMGILIAGALGDVMSDVRGNASPFAQLFAPTALGAQEVLTVYSHRHYPVDRVLFDQFERREGVRIRVLQARADELIERIAAEGRRTPADVLVTVSAARLDRARERNILTPFRSARIEEHIPAALRHERNYWTALTARARIIVYNRAMADEGEVRRYNDLALPRWRGALVMRTSAHVYNVSLLSAIINARGREEAKRWVRGVAQNLAYAPRGNDRDQIRAVARGDAAATVVNSYYYALLLAGEEGTAIADAVAVSFPNQDERGAHIDISGIGIVRHSSHQELATKLIEFLTSPAVQEQYAAQNYEFPANPAAKTTGIVAEWGDIKFDVDAVRTLSQHSEAAVNIYDASDWN